MKVHRICRLEHSAFDGAGGLRFPGRWHIRGTAVVYASGSLALATLEILAHLVPGTAPSGLVSVTATLPDELAVERVEARDLPRNWRAMPAPEALREIGTRWRRDGRTAVLSVPSAIVPAERNFLLHPLHADFARVELGAPAAFEIDRRLVR